jgi:cytochrome c2
LILLGLAAICSISLGLSYSLADAQAIVPIEAEEINPKIVETADEWTDVVWDGTGEHPGQKLYEKCELCHSLDDAKKVGPGFAGLWERIESVEYQGTVRERLFNFVVDPAPDSQEDPYFKPLATGGMPARGMLATDAEVRAVLDFILRHTYGKSGGEGEWRKNVTLGGDLARGSKSFAEGAPSCTSCHTVGPQPGMRGSNVGPNVAHTFNEAMALGGTDETLYVEGLQEVLAGKDAPAMHSYYRNDEGACNLTDSELTALMTFFERQLREVGTERTSNYLPLIALILAAFSLLFIDGSFYSKLFVKAGPEAVDGPYEEDDHGHGDHGHSDPEPEEPKAEDKPEDSSEDSDADSKDDSADEKSDADADENEESEEDAEDKKD